MRPLKLELEVFVSHLVLVLEIELRFSAKSDALFMAEPPLQPYVRFCI